MSKSGVAWSLVPIEDRLLVHRPYQGTEQARRARNADGAPVEQMVSEEQAEKLRATFPGCTRRAGRYLGVVMETGFAMVHEDEVVGEGSAEPVGDLPKRRTIQTPDGATLVKPKKDRAKRAAGETVSLDDQDARAVVPGPLNDCGASSRVKTMTLRLDSTPVDSPMFEAYERARKREHASGLPEAVVQGIAVLALKAAIRRDPRLPPPGTPMRRQLHGSTVEAIEQPDGQFACGIVGDDNSVELYSSLSRAASAVAGSSQNGYVWFKLGKKE